MRPRPTLPVHAPWPRVQLALSAGLALASCAPELPLTGPRAPLVPAATASAKAPPPAPCAGRHGEVSGATLSVKNGCDAVVGSVVLVPPIRVLPGGGPVAFLVADGEGRLSAVGPADDGPRFTTGLFGALRAARVLANGDIGTLTQHGQVARLDPTGRPRWLVTIPRLDRGARAMSQDPRGAALAEGEDGVLLVGDDGRDGVAHHLALGPDGTVRWWQSLPPTADLGEPTSLARQGSRAPAGASTSADGFGTAPVKGLGFERFPVGDGVALVAGSGAAAGRVWLLRRPERAPAGPTELLTFQESAFRAVPLPERKGTHAFDPRGLAWLPEGALALTGLDQTLTPTGPRSFRVEASRPAVLRVSVAASPRFEPASAELARLLGDSAASGLLGAAPGAFCGEGVCALHTGTTWAGLALDDYAPRSDGHGEWAPPVARVGDSVWVGGARLHRQTPAGFQADTTGPTDVRALWAASPTEVWALAKERLWHWTSPTWQSTPAPMKGLVGLGGTGPRDVWAVGLEGALHFDGERWSRAAGLGGRLSLVVAAGPEDAWFAGADGVFHGTRSEETITTSAPPAPPAPTREGATPWTPAKSVTATLVPEPLRGADGRPFTRIQELAVAPDGTLWARSEQEVVERSPRGTVRSLGSVDDTFAASERATGGLAPRREGRGWFAGPRGLTAVDGKAHTVAPLGLAATLALATTGEDAVWAAGASSEPGAPHLLFRQGTTTRLVGVPDAIYASLAARGAEAWVVGALDGSPGALRGEGLIVHVGPGEPEWLRVGPGPVVAVATPQDREAYAVGPAGLVAHAQNGHLTLRAVRPPVDLRAVWARGPGEVWFCGARGALYRLKDAELTQVVVKGRGEGESLWGLAGTEKELWVLGDGGVSRVVLSPP